MKGLRALFDISSFFLVMIINLLLIALLCYYFKKKFENLEKAQMEQAKILYGLIENNNSLSSQNIVSQVMSENSESFRETQELHELLNNTDTKVVQLTNNEVVSESESDDETDSDDEDSDESEDTNASNPILNAVELHVEKLPSDLQTLEITELDNKNNEDDIKELTNVENLDDTVSSSTPLEKLTVKQLNELLKEKGLKSGKNMKKVEIIELLQKTE